MSDVGRNSFFNHDWRDSLPSALNEDWLDVVSGGEVIHCYHLIDGIDCLIGKNGTRLFLNGLWSAPVPGFHPDDLFNKTYISMVKAGVGFTPGHYTMTGPGVTGSSGNDNPYNLKRVVLVPNKAFYLCPYSMSDIKRYASDMSLAGVICQCGISFAVAPSKNFKSGKMPLPKPTPTS